MSGSQGEPDPMPTIQRSALVEHSAARMFALVNDVLDYSALEAGRLEYLNEPFSMSQVLDETLLPAQHLAKNPSSLFLFLLSVPVTVWIDSFDSWCSSVNPAGGRRWWWHCLCAVRFSCAPLFYQCTCVVLCLF